MRRMARVRGWLSAAALASIAAGCAEHRLTREPDPPVSTAGWGAIWIAAVAAGLLLTALLVRRVAHRGCPSTRRFIAATVFLAGAVALVMGLAYFVSTVLRARQILGWQECRQIPLEKRPLQIIQLSCSPELDDPALDILAVAFFTAVMGGVALLFTLAAVSLLRGSGRPWAATALAGIATVGTVAQAGAALGQDTSAPEWLALGIASVAAMTAAACCLAELRYRQ